MADILFWGATAALLLACAALMAAAVLRGRTLVTDRSAADLKVYKDQLRDVERDLARGVITADEATRLRTEIGRRVLTADSLARAEAGRTGGTGPSVGLTLALVLPLLIAGAYGVYALKGAPQWGDQPIKARLAEAAEARAARPSQAEAEQISAAQRPPAPIADARHEELVGELRRVMQNRPDDLEGHRLLARNEALLGNVAAAAAAQGRVNEILGDQVQIADLEAQADLMIMAAGGRVSPEAEAVLSRILARDRSNGLARYYSGLSLAETGRYDLAFRFWAPLWADSRADDPWVPILQKELPELAWAAGQHRYEMPPLAAATRGPDAAAIEAAKDLSAEDRAAMIRGMVEGLMARLASEGGTAAEWAQLITALGVSGDIERGRAILSEARERFVGQPEDLARINQAAKAAGFDAP